jgi:hypothetical protein
VAAGCETGFLVSLVTVVLPGRSDEIARESFLEPVETGVSRAPAFIALPDD